MSTTVNADDSRVNVVIRFIGAFFFIFGLIMTYLTYSSASLQAPLIPVLYLCSGMLMVAGFAALVVKYRPSGTT